MTWWRCNGGSVSGEVDKDEWECSGDTRKWCGGGRCFRVAVVVLVEVKKVQW